MLRGQWGDEMMSYTSSWQPNGAVKHLPTKGGSLRYLDVGHGQPLLLIHTLRTQLDYFQELIPLLGGHRILALDLPGHGYSSIPRRAHFDEPFFRAKVAEFITKLGLRNVTVVGESIGGVVALTVAATMPDRVAHVIALNPYDYGEKFGGGIRRSRHGSIVGLFALFGRFTPETSSALWKVLSGGFAEPARLNQGLFLELVRAGRQRNYRLAEYRLYKHWHSWLEARRLYRDITIPVTLVYGEYDWSSARERVDNERSVPHAELHILPGVGHFSTLEAPRQVADIIRRAENRTKAQGMVSQPVAA